MLGSWVVRVMRKPLQSSDCDSFQARIIWTVIDTKGQLEDICRSFNKVSLRSIESLKLLQVSFFVQVRRQFNQTCWQCIYLLKNLPIVLRNVPVEVLSCPQVPFPILHILRGLAVVPKDCTIEALAPLNQQTKHGQLFLDAAEIDKGYPITFSRVLTNWISKTFQQRFSL